MNICGIYDNSVTNGDGMRLVLFVSGCCHNCKGCHNPETHNCSYGYEFDEKEFFDRIKKNELILDGITFSGGDPFHPKNIHTIEHLAEDIHNNFSSLDIWLYTGYTYEEVLEKYGKKVLMNIDVLVDGKFEIDNLETQYRYKGSSNQRILKLSCGDIEKELFYEI